MGSRGSTIPANSHLTRYRVCYGDTDCMGRVYYANYFVFFERARTELLRAVGHRYSRLEAAGIFLPVRRCEARFFGYAVYDDELELHTWISRLRRATITFASGVLRRGEGGMLVKGVVELACIDSGFKPVPLPEEIALALQPYLAPGD